MGSHTAVGVVPVLGGQRDSWKCYIKQRVMLERKPFEKNFEKSLKRDVISHLEKFNIIPDCQHGFLKDRFTEIALLPPLSD